MTSPSTLQKTNMQKRASGKPSHWPARILVLLQFAIAAAIVLGTAWTDQLSFLRFLLAGILLVVGSGLAVWAWLVMGWRRLRIMPHPASDAQLLQQGPYRWIRHPMYAGLLIAAAGCVGWDADLFRGVLWLGLALVLVAKSKIEEELLCEKFADYPLYRAKSWRFFPGVW